MSEPHPAECSAPPLICPGTDAEFDLLRSFLAGVSFDDATLCRSLGMQDMSDLGQVDWNGKSSDLNPRLRLAVEFFIRGFDVAHGTLVDSFGGDTVAVLKSLGLLKTLSRCPERCFCPVWLYPADGFLIVSDRHDNPESGEHSPAADVVFPAIYGGTLRFLKLLPEAGGGDVLDLCGGSGIGAFHLSRTARTAATSDLTSRSARFAAFNARLNNLPVESLCGDLYEPVGDRQFDLITAHPPFVPATGSNMVYRDAGETGEDVSRGVIAGLPAHLRPGGRCVVLCVARDTIDEGIEARARGWLGGSAGEFDVIFALEKVLTVDEVVDSLRKRGQSFDNEAAARLRERLLAASTKRFVYGALLIERCPAGCRLKPARARMLPETAAADFEALLRVRRARNRSGFDEWLAGSRPRLASGLELKARHIVRDGELVPAEFVFSVETPLPAALRIDGFVVPLVARLTGQFTVREVFEYAAKQGELPAGFPLEAYLNLVGCLIEEGLLKVEFPA